MKAIVVKSSELLSGPWTYDYGNMLLGTFVMGVNSLAGEGFERAVKDQLKRLDRRYFEKDVVDDVLFCLAEVCRRRGFHAKLISSYPLARVRERVRELRKSADELVELAGERRLEAEKLEGFLNERMDSKAQS